MDLEPKWHVLFPSLGLKTLPVLSVSASQSPRQRILIMQCKGSGLCWNIMMEGTQVPERPYGKNRTVLSDLAHSPQIYYVRVKKQCICSLSYSTVGDKTSFYLQQLPSWDNKSMSNQFGKVWDFTYQ